MRRETAKKLKEGEVGARVRVKRMPRQPTPRAQPPPQRRVLLPRQHPPLPLGAPDRQRPEHAAAVPKNWPDAEEVRAARRHVTLPAVLQVVPLVQQGVVLRRLRRQLRPSPAAEE